MRIASVAARAVRVRLREPTSVSRGILLTLDCLLVLVRGETGALGSATIEPLGRGKAGPDSLAGELAAEIQQSIACRLVGLDIDEAAVRLGTQGADLAIPAMTRSALDVAVADLRAQAAGIPLSRLLGEPVHQRISLVGWIGKCDPATTAERGLDWIARGFMALKVKIGRSEGDDVDRIAALRDAVGPRIQIRVDANGRFDPETAIGLIRRMQKYNVAYCEQPSGRGDDHSPLATIRRAVDMPILADEGVRSPKDIENLYAMGAADLIKIRIMKQGGLQATLDMVRCAESLGIGCVLGHGFGLTPSTVAELHVAAVAPYIMQPCEMVGPLRYLDDVVEAPLSVKNGFAQVPENAGLGVTVSAELRDLCNEKTTA